MRTAKNPYGTKESVMGFIQRMVRPGTQIKRKALIEMYLMVHPELSVSSTFSIINDSIAELVKTNVLKRVGRGVYEKIAE